MKTEAGLQYHVRLMCEEDIPQVNEIDREAFPTQWPPPNYMRELHNRMAHYIVASEDDKATPKPVVKVPDRNGRGLIAYLLRLFNHRDRKQPQPVEHIIGFAGFWVMAEEAHITNIAVRQQWQRQGIGEILLMAIIDLAIEKKAENLTLEVRVSNTPAQNLYRKYGFAEVGLRRGYYTDNREDAVLMSTEKLASDSFQALLRQLKDAYPARYGRPVSPLIRECPPPQGAG